MNSYSTAYEEGGGGGLNLFSLVLVLIDYHIIYVTLPCYYLLLTYVKKLLELRIALNFPRVTPRTMNSTAYEGPGGGGGGAQNLCSLVLFLIDWSELSFSDDVGPFLPLFPSGPNLLRKLQFGSHRWLTNFWYPACNLANVCRHLCM